MPPTSQNPTISEQTERLAGTHRRIDKETHGHSTQVTQAPLSASVMLKDAALYSLQGGFKPKSLLRFARGVVAADFAGTVEDAFAVWWSFASKRIPDDPESREHLLILYRDTVANLKPSVAGALEQAVDYASTAPTLPGMCQSLSRLASGCLYLQRLSGKEPFFLSVRGAAKLIGMANPFHASAYLRELQRIRWLTMVAKGKNEGRQASTWRIAKPL